jgi:hypothetical protein
MPQTAKSGVNRFAALSSSTLLVVCITVSLRLWDGVLSIIGSYIGRLNTITALARFQIASGRYASGNSLNSFQHETDKIGVVRPRAANALVLETSIDTPALKVLFCAHVVV